MRQSGLRPIGPRVAVHDFLLADVRRAVRHRRLGHDRRTSSGTRRLDPGIPARAWRVHHDLARPQVHWAAVLRARLGRGPASRIDDMLEWLALVLTTYSMAGTGFVTALAWDSLAFDRRGRRCARAAAASPHTIMAAKLAALGTFLAAGSLPINLLNAAVFATVTGDQLGWTALVTHLVDMFAATVAASIFVFRSDRADPDDRRVDRRAAPYGQPWVHPSSSCASSRC